MRGFLMLSRGIRRTVHLDKNEPRRIIRLLDYIEPGDPRFENALACVFDCGLAERADELGFYVGVHVNNEH